eukprot:1155934-Pelagomonas_calceolata.AAC.1
MDAQAKLWFHAQMQARGQALGSARLSRGGQPLLNCPPNFSGPAGAFRTQTFDAGLFFVCIWDNPHQKMGGRSSHARVAVRGKGNTIC